MPLARDGSELGDNTVEDGILTKKKWNEMGVKWDEMGDSTSK